MKNILMFIMMLLMPMISQAALPSWIIIPNESSISFTATQNNAPVSGKFKEFTAVIHGDSQQVGSSNVQIKIILNSVSTTYSLVADTLKTADWLNVKQYPEAVFESKNITMTALNHYQSTGMLTLRGKTLPVVANFTAENIFPHKMMIKGTVVIKRTVFGVGQGDFSKTDEVKDDVTVSFVLAMIKK